LLTIASGRSICTLLPAAGGSIGSWGVDGQDMLRAALDDSDPLQSASFPLIPYSNRIANAQFDWGGHPVSLLPNPVAAPHAIHGIGWQREWEGVQAGPDTAVMTLRHQPDADWPWPVYAEQRIKVTDNSLELELYAPSITDEIVPLGFGHHCYFDSAGAHLQFVAERFYPNGADMLPLDAMAVGGDTAFTFGRQIADGDFDNCFGGWDGKARIEWADRGYALMIESDLPDAVLYTPRGGNYFCFEPVPHITNALNRSDGDMPRVAPVHSFTASIHLRAVATG
jgi:aldose 1-epimerase